MYTTQKKDKLGINREYLEKLQKLIDETEANDKDFEKEIHRISLKDKYKMEQLDGVGWLKIENIVIYMKNEGLLYSYKLLDHDLTQISGIGEAVEKRIKQRIRQIKDKIVEFR